MAESATEFLLNNLKELVLYHAHLIIDTKDNIDKLERDLLVFQAFLKDTVKTRKKSEQIMQMWKDIHNIVYEIEDIIDAYIAKTNQAGQQSRFTKILKNRARNLHKIGKKVEGIKDKVQRLMEQIGHIKVEEDEDEPEPRPPRKDSNVVGFVDVTEHLIQRLTQETAYFDVISLIGMFGLGKTTLAWKIFNDPRIILQFPTRIWLPVSQQFTEKEIFLRILKNLTTLNDDIRAKDAGELAESVASYLQKGSFLIVMDDVWSDPDWEKLRRALPLDFTRGKVLVTSRLENVGVVASKPRPIVPLRFFTKQESWELFRLEALGKLECPRGLEGVGKVIAENCGGVPLAIVIIGGILYESLDPNVDATKKKWQKVSEHVTSYLNEKDKSERMRKFISLSYENLPHHLRHCFLYLGLFPEDFEISATKLIRMWIAEGFIQWKNEYDSLEEIGVNYLKDLISRNLVKTVRFRPDGNVKTCQIHDTLRDFCRKEAATENFLQEIKYNNEGNCVPPISSSCRRLSVHSDCKRYISSKPSVPRVRSFVCFSDHNYALSPVESSKIIEAFELLRVFDVLPFKFDTIDSELYNLVLMRYIALSFKLSILPSHFNKIWNMQTLIIDTTSPTLDVKADIWKMRHLRHFKTNAPAKFYLNSNDSANELQTLGLISMECCTNELPRRAPNLKKLGIGGKLASLFQGEVGSFDSLRNMKHLGKLKLVNNVPQETAKLNCLPLPNQFPSGLTSLTLCFTFLGWEQISTIGSLVNLEVLKLKDRAFVGNSWDLKGGGFPSLQFLHIERIELAFWEASSSHYPKLRGLVLKHCDKLREIPIELAKIQSFKMLELTTCTSAVKPARDISAEKKKTSAEGSEFKLSIFPPAPIE